MTERDFTTGIQTIKMKPERVTVIWKRNCRSCGTEFKTDDKNQWVCDRCIKTYEFTLGRLDLAKKAEIEVPLNELRIVQKNE